MCPGLPRDPSLVPILPGPTPLLHPALCRFSGVTEADLVDTSITLRDVQAVLLSMFSADTILIGHSLESDLLALKVIHGTVVDTSVLFPHRLGLPYKRSLRNLMADYLRQIIQDNGEELGPGREGGEGGGGEEGEVRKVLSMCAL